MTNPSRIPLLAWLAIFILLFSAKLALAEPYKPDAGPHTVDSFLLDLHDNQRDRTVPIKIYTPKNTDKPKPLVLVSHGLGGTRQGLSYLGKHFASHGYTAVHLQHPGSDDAVWRNRPPKDILAPMRKAATTPQVAIDRANDVPFVLDQLTRLNDDPANRLHNQLDLDRVAIAGHSFGAWSAMAAGGITLGGNEGKSLGDPRITCIIPLSPPVANERHRIATYASLNVPALFMTGTLDTSPINDTTAEQRLIPYQLTPGPAAGGAPKYLINFNGADHMTFAGRTTPSPRSKVSQQDNQTFHSLILQSTTAFLDCYLLENPDAKDWLNHGGFNALLDNHAQVNMQTQTPKEPRTK